jgi:hypothetical protein
MAIKTSIPLQALFEFIFFRFLIFLRLLAFIPSQNVRPAGRHPLPGLSRTSSGYRTLVAVQTEIMTVLQIQRSIAE